MTEDLDPESAQALAQALAPPRLRPPPWVMAFALGLAVLVAWSSRDALAYWLRPAVPVDLGTLGSYRLDRLQDNTFARISGALGPPMERTTLFGSVMQVRVVVSTNVFVERPKGKPGPPELLAYKGQGRLVRAGGSRAYQVVAAFVRGRFVSEEKEVWILVDGDRPREGLGLPVSAALVLAFAALNGYGLWRAFRGRD